ncbi:hypothetical protein GCM10022225_68630 [Plantactinospora mayteni]|uniref:Uncharacterized protein n=1 Tax=Plantactinospora mayteni TaxID=566021 RepID=A0ABQ4F0X1_9ACTN|nr:hypothetical protein [Plantactinospora mayteni]GIH00554.1 hypothetical protein Pma05_71260 [Plantactinospora mayteni]
MRKFLALLAMIGALAIPFAGAAPASASTVDTATITSSAEAKAADWVYLGRFGYIEDCIYWGREIVRQHPDWYSAVECRTNMGTPQYPYELWGYPR